MKIFLLMNNNLIAMWNEPFSLGAFNESDLSPFFYITILLIILFFFRKERIKENAFNFENKDVLNQTIEKRDVSPLPFTTFNLKRAYWSLFLFFTVIMLIFVFIKG